MLRIGVLGAGHIGKIHIQLILELKEQFQLIGFYDSNKENAKKVSEKFGIKSFNSKEELIELVDCVDIATPTINHFESASYAIRKSKHVFLEKPITYTLDEAKVLINLALEANVKVQVGHVERFNPAFIASLPFIQKPMFIEVHRLAEFNPRGTDVSVVLDLMIHDLDIVLSVVKSGVKRVSASGVSVVSETPDITSARIEFDNGCVVNFTASRFSMNNMRKIRFFQKNSYVSVDFLNHKLDIVKMEDIEGEYDPFDVVINLGEGKKSKKLCFDKPNIENTNAIKEEFKTFYKSILEDITPIVSITDGYNALDLAQKIIDKINGSPMLIADNI
ncbi:MAG: Gfo/Idh/MocA family oxidoreductase [Flavobacteriia bacterium]|nr:Gfo/Idh/MocA family oxidoreductase [Flavobacteriia bacterium]